MVQRVVFVVGWFVKIQAAAVNEAESNAWLSFWKDRLRNAFSRSVWPATDCIPGDVHRKFMSWF